MPFTLRNLAAAAAVLAVSASVHAQPKPPTRLVVRGTIDQIGDATLEVAQRNGQKIMLALPADAAIRSVSNAKLSDIKPDSFIGAAAAPQPDGTLKALEVHVFAASLRGSGEGNRPWEGAGGKSGSMTNGTVGSLVNSNGTTMTVKYKNGEKTIVVPPDVPIVYMEPADRSVLKIGVPVLIFPAKTAQGGLVAKTVIAGKNGVVPPM